MTPSYDEPTRQAQCEGKARFFTKPKAERAAKRLRRRATAVVAPYHCPHCKRFHIGERMP